MPASTADFVSTERHCNSGRVLMMVGPAGSGKTTLARQFAAGAGGAVVSYDRHQRAIPGDDGVESVSPRALAAAWQELTTCCAAGTPVVVDGTHSQAERRARVRAIASAAGYDTVAVVVLTPLEVCQARQDRRVRKVPPADVARQHAAITAALPELTGEGYAAVIHLPG